jgi:hypothetical protein
MLSGRPRAGAPPIGDNRIVRPDPPLLRDPPVCARAAGLALRVKARPGQSRRAGSRLLPGSRAGRVPGGYWKPLRIGNWRESKQGALSRSGPRPVAADQI